jgi:hypothetical protein
MDFGRPSNQHSRSNDTFVGFSTRYIQSRPHGQTNPYEQHYAHAISTTTNLMTSPLNST